MTPDLPLTLFVDRSCPLCAREVLWLERSADPARLLLVDISAANFSTDGLGLDLPQLRRRLHARSASGAWLTRVDATYWSWPLARHGRWAAPLGWRPLRPLLLLGYQLFAVLRPHLEWLPHPEGANRCTTQCSAPEKSAPTSDRPAGKQP
jgi:predicted DCC family thiol-disulfide oxidoreductase YuxK